VSKRFFSEITWTIETKLPRNDHWKVLYKVSVFYADLMYSLALIIFVVSEKKAFEHFPIWSNVNLCPAVVAIYKLSVFYADRKSKMASTAGHRLTLDAMGKCSNVFFSETTNMVSIVQAFQRRSVLKHFSHRVQC
jgi:hypothetical protein